MVGLAMGVGLLSLPPASASRKYRIGVNIWKVGTIYDESLKGVVDGLAEVGLDYEIITLNSRNSEKRAEDNFRQLMAANVDLILSFGSEGTQVAHRIVMEVPIVANVINHPVALRFAMSVESSGNNITGVSYFIPPILQLQFYQKLMPTLNRLAFIYDLSNPAGVQAELPALREACEQLGITFVPVGINRHTELEAATRQMIEQVDAFTVATNKMVYQYLADVLKVTEPARIPVFSLNKQGVEAGALAALYADTYKLGRLSVSQIVSILSERKKPSAVAFKFTPAPDIFLNIAAAKRIGFDFPPTILDVATVIHTKEIGAELVTETGQVKH
jgi:putative ABC transport system substrate-binding protein